MSLKVNRWWAGRDEPFWIEITGRDDIGADLNAPALDESGNVQWTYEFVKEPDEGDVVFHFKAGVGFVGQSVVVGQAWPDTVVWGARGTSARGLDVEPYARDGLRRGLQGFSPVDGPNLDDVRSLEEEILEVRRNIQKSTRGSIYFPFAPYKGQPLRTAQGYMMKLPRELVEVLGLPSSRLSSGVRTKPSSSTAASDRNAPRYRRADESVAISKSEPFDRDPAVMERALKSHRTTQNLLADWAANSGFEPQSPEGDEPDFDVAWQGMNSFVVVEVKSIHPVSYTHLTLPTIYSV